MLAVYIVILVLFAWPSTHLLAIYMRSPEQKPGIPAIAGIILCTAAMLAYLIWLMRMAYFF